MYISDSIATFGRYLQLMWRVLALPERWRMFGREYVKEMASLGVDSLGIVVLISFFIGAVICIQIKLNIASPWMPGWTTGYTTREIMLLEFSSSIMCLILAGKVGSNIASEIGTMKVTQQIDALEIMGVNSASFVILPKIAALITMIPFLVIFSALMGFIGAYATSLVGVINVDDVTAGLQHDFNQWYVWMSLIKSLFFAFIISSVSAFYGYTFHRRRRFLVHPHPLFRHLPDFHALMIELKQIRKAFDGREVLKGIDAVFEDGKTNLIIGQSGSGKTVLIKNVVGLYVPTSGQVLYDGRDINAMTKKEKALIHREMGMIFQSAALFDSMSVLENVMFPLDMFSDMNTADRVKRAKYCLSRVNLAGAEDKFPGEISGGMQKRAAIARAIALNPKYLFCDEPNSGLDPKTSIVIDQLIHSITKEYNMTTVVNTHDMNSVMGIGEKIIYLANGVKEWEGTKDQIMSSTNESLNSFIFASDLFRKVKEANR